MNSQDFGFIQGFLLWSVGIAAVIVAQAYFLGKLVRSYNLKK